VSQKKTVSRNIVFVLSAVAMVALIALGASLIIYEQQSNSLKDKDAQIADLQNNSGAPKLVSIGLNYTDDRSNANAPFLHITGFVVNVGSSKANNCTVHVNAEQSGNVTALDTIKTITSLDAGAHESIDIQFPYTGTALEAYTSYLAWTN
jgi:hypothetical protein